MASNNTNKVAVLKTVFLSEILQRNDMSIVNGEHFMSLTRTGQTVTIRNHPAIVIRLETTLNNILRCRVIYDLPDAVVTDEAFGDAEASEEAEDFDYSDLSPGTLFAGVFGNQNDDFATKLLDIPPEGEFVLEEDARHSVAQAFYQTHKDHGAYHDKARGVIFMSRYAGARNNISALPMAALENIFSNLKLPGHLEKTKIESSPALKKEEAGAGRRPSNSAPKGAESLGPSVGLVPDRRGKTYIEINKAWAKKDIYKIVNLISNPLNDIKSVNTEGVKKPCREALKKLLGLVRRRVAEGGCSFEVFFKAMRQIFTTEAMYTRALTMLNSQFSFDGEEMRVTVIADRAEEGGYPESDDEEEEY